MRFPGSAMRSDVRSVTIDEAVELIIDHRGRTPKKLGGDFSFDGVQVVSAKHVYRGRLHLDENRRFVPLEMAKRWMPTKLLAGDVLLTSEAPLGEAAYLNENTDLCLGQRLFALRARPTVAHHRFLYYALRSPLVQRRLHARATGTTAQGIKQSELRQVELELPPAVEQGRIAAVLGALDDKIDSNERVRHSADAVAATLFRSIAGTEAIEQTSVQTLIEQRVILIGDGLRAKNSELGLEGLPFARAGNLNDGFDFATADRVPESLAHRAGAKCSVPGDVVFTSKGTVGRFALVDEWTEPCVYSPQLCFWRSLDHDRLPPAVLYWWMQSPIATQQLDALKGQTDMADYVSLRDQRSIVLSLPQPATRLRLATALEPLAALVGSLRAESRTLAKIRDVLLPKLISGEIRVSDASDRDAAIGRAAGQLAGAKR
jgi:type I restriction enzyme S subunit